MSSIWYMFAKARKLAIAKNDNRHFQLGAVSVRFSDGKLVGSANGHIQWRSDYSKLNSCGLASHAETRLAKKLVPNSEVFVARVSRKDGSYQMSRPCKNCQRVLKSVGVHKVYYTIADNEYGILEL